MKAKLDIKTIQALNLFERITRIKAKGCFPYDNSLIFTVHPAFLRKLQRSKLGYLGKQLNTNIKVIPTPLGKTSIQIHRFVKNLVSCPFKKMTLEDQKLTFSVPSTKTRAVFMGRDKIRLRQLTDALKRFFDIKEVNVR
ncbi:MAG: hypothetical protein JSW08_00630 [archaeon]|nr:MAG: hypothetical protein JSW08_00630 [archaeon]